MANSELLHIRSTPTSDTARCGAKLKTGRTYEEVRGRTAHRPPNTVGCYECIAALLEAPKSRHKGFVGPAR